ncbi:hypothetical protein [Halorussus lipolyticus]|uniref:hypothetical protein n=1 Tax=Halorussus lipolyticus TaxID=3034024 RepID=UPI0023E863E2|nr:hypothetical protein [Halorussus sp. DT80]
MGKISSKVRAAVAEFCDGKITKSEFKKRLNEIYCEHPNAGNIGRAIQAGLKSGGSDATDKQKVWKAADEVSQDFQDEFEDWKSSFGL